MAKTLRRVKKTRQVITQGVVTIVAGFNNTHVTISDKDGNALVSVSAGAAGFKGAREATPYAAQITAEQAAEKARTLHSLESVVVYVKWVGVGREQAVRGLINMGLNLEAIYDVTPIPHNGCRKKKVRKL